MQGEVATIKIVVIYLNILYVDKYSKLFSRLNSLRALSYISVQLTAGQAN